MAVVIVFVNFVVPAVAGYGQDAAQMSEPFGTCAQHSVAPSQCTVQVWAQLVQAGDKPRLDSRVAWGVFGVQAVQAYLKNPESLQIRSVFVREVGESSSLADGPIVCYEVSAQNALGGTSLGSFAFYLSKNKKHREKEKLAVDHHTEGGDRDISVGFGGVLGWMGWEPRCGNVGPGQGGQDITDQVKQALQPVAAGHSDSGEAASNKESPVRFEDMEAAVDKAMGMVKMLNASMEKLVGWYKVKGDSEEARQLRDQVCVNLSAVNEANRRATGFSASQMAEAVRLGKISDAEVAALTNKVKEFGALLDKAHDLANQIVALGFPCKEAN